ncbi:MAG: two-component sensor histidine kinase [Chloroflexota bacterium]|nr:sensor histidine kinase [Chloroflexota bacterium]NOG65453.1 HAMP domain-containing histidine kinase [Chloroflexota bacterium]GIK64368.1 MAG: two-component sensor histidine kinase [Chloroflexota bacterium]
MPLRIRFVLWYGGLFVAILFIVMGLSYAFHVRSHYDSLDHTLITSTDHAANESIGELDSPRLEQIGKDLEVSLRLYDANGTLLETTTKAEELPRSSPQAILAAPAKPPFDSVANLVPSVLERPHPAEGSFGVISERGHRWRIYVLPLKQGGYLEALVSLDALDRAVRALRILMAVLGLVGLAAALLGSWAVASRALLPITVVDKTARSIALSRNFSQRVPLSARHDELGHLIETLNEMLGSLQAAYYAQQRFVADASHELRAPLTIIQGNLELFARHQNIPVAERQEILADIQDEAVRLSRLVADLLTLARADSGTTLNHYPIELDTILLGAFREAKQLAQGQTLFLDTFEPAQIMGDEDRLKQLVLILLDNAIKYTAPNGQVHVTLRRKTNVVEIVVQDTGIGIPAEALPHIFDRFYRADPARSHDPGGTGLGLSIARWITEQHGGQIAVTSTLGEGTSVSVSLPIGPR